MLHLNVVLPRNRNAAGWLRVERDGCPLAEFRVLGRGSRGPGDTSFLSRGNTPTGTYQGTEFVETRDWNQASYGPWGAVRLKPTSGDALLAEDVYGRRGLLIHGGAPATSGAWMGGLKPTLGCLRLANNDVRALREIIESERNDETRQICQEAEIQVTVRT